MNRRDFIKFGGAAAASTALFPLTSAAGISPSDVSIRWLGGAMLELQIGDVRILTDPCIGEGKEAFEMGDPNEMFDLSRGPNIKMHERFTPFPGMAMTDYNVVLLSHAHEDHFDQRAQTWLGSTGPVLCPTHDVKALTNNGFNAQDLGHGKNRIIQSGDTKVSITSIPAIHSLNKKVSDILGLGNGYWIRATILGKVLNIYWAGDTFLADPVRKAIQQFPTPDILIPHIGAVGINGTLGQLSMNGYQAIELAEFTEADLVLPIHHSTYALYQEPASKMVEAHAVSGIPSVLRVLEEGLAVTL